MAFAHLALMFDHIASHALKAFYLMVSHHAIKNVHQTAISVINHALIALQQETITALHAILDM